MNAADLNQFFAEAFPHGRSATVEHADGKTTRTRLSWNQTQLRPGGTLSAPAARSPARP